LSTTANESICECRNGRELSEVDECKLSILETGGLYNCRVISSDTKEARSKCRSLTLKSSLTPLLAATPENQPLWIHRGKVLCSLKAQSDVGSNDNDSLACKIDVFHRGYLPPLVLDVLEKTDSSHDIGCNALVQY